VVYQQALLDAEAKRIAAESLYNAQQLNLRYVDLLRWPVACFAAVAIIVIAYCVVTYILDRSAFRKNAEDNAAEIEIERIRAMVAPPTTEAAD
jgi:hypothetical protein